MKSILSRQEVLDAYAKWLRGNGTQQQIADELHVHINTLTRAFNFYRCGELEAHYE